MPFKYIAFAFSYIRMLNSITTKLRIQATRIRGGKESLSLRSRIFYELPFFILYVLTFHASIYGLHEALMKLSNEFLLSHFLKESAKIASTYKVLYEKTKSFTRSMYLLIERINIQNVATFLRRYLFVYLISGKQTDIVTRGLNASIDLMKRNINSRISFANIVVEVIIIFSTIILFLGIILSSKLIALAYAVMIFFLLISFEVYVPLITLMVYEVTIVRKVLFVVTVSSSLASFAIYMSTHNTVLSLILIIPSVFSSSLIIYLFSKSMLLFTSSIDKLKYFARIVELGIDNVESVNQVLAKIDKRTWASLNSFTLIDGYEHNNKSFASVFSNMITSLILNFVRSGVNASVSIEAIADFLEILSNELRSLIMRSIAYNAVLFGSLALLGLSLCYVNEIITSMNYSLQGINSFPILLPLSSLNSGVTELLSMMTIGAFMGSLTIAKVMRGSITLYFEAPVLPLLYIMLSFFLG